MLRSVSHKSYHPSSVDEYIGSQPEAVQSLLGLVRTAIRMAVPKAEEVIAYKIPAYKLHGQPVLYFAGWKKHYSLYPASDRMVAAFQEELASYTVNKGTIRFPLTQPVPVKLIGRIATFRAKEIAEGQRRRSATVRDTIETKRARSSGG
jgi:uncharacterized protein YdhG (YjbR/CyaY superfamily)